MTVLATVSAQEHLTLLTNNYISQYFEVILLDAPGEVYEPGSTIDETFLQNEVVTGTGGYRRKVFTYEVTDIAAYTDRGMGLVTKTATFAHDGSLTPINFTHVGLLRGTGNVSGIFESLSSEPTAGNDGTYLNVPTTTSGNGYGATLDIVVTGGNTFTATIGYPGYGYEDVDNLNVADSVLASLGIITAGAGGLSVSIETVTVDNAGHIVSIAPTTDAISLANGNEAVFYFNVKHFGYSNVTGA